MSTDPRGEPDPEVPMTPAEATGWARVMADTFLGLPEDGKAAALESLKHHNPVLHALTVARIKHIREAAGGKEQI